MATNPPMAPPPNGNTPSNQAKLQALKAAAGIPPANNQNAAKNQLGVAIAGQAGQAGNIAGLAGLAGLNPGGLVGGAGIGVGAGVFAPSAMQGQVMNTKEPNTPWRLRHRFPAHIFHKGVPLHTGFVGYNDDNMHFLLSVWQKAEQVDTDLYGIMLTHSEYTDLTTWAEEPGRVTLLFSDEKECERFKLWLSKYSERFVGGNVFDEYVPTIKSGVRVSGYPMPVSQNSDGRALTFFGEMTKEWFDDWVWIVANTHDPVVFSNGFWLFQNESEMVMFKLRGGK